MATDTRATLEHIRELIATPSISSVSTDWDTSNTPLIAGLAGRLEDAGWQIEILEIPGKPGKQNLLATLGKDEGKGDGLVLSGHSDTVPYDAGRWSTDPFTLTEKDQKLYGLGTADMKSFLALAMAAAAEFESQKFRQPLKLLATADEECTMSGARALELAGIPHARCAVIGEPTSLQPIRMHKGIFMESILITGQSGHSSDPNLGNNALEGMQAVIQELLKWRDEMRTGPLHEAFAVPYSTLNLGHIHGGDNPNRICGSCELQIDLRFIPSLNRAELRSELHQRLQTALNNHNQALEITFKPLFEGVEPMDTAADTEIVRYCEELSGLQSGAVAYATEAPFLHGLGMDVVVMGPGSIDQAHQPDEYLPLEQIKPAIEMLQRLIKRFCVGSA